MRLTRLEIFGFKSFVERFSLQFDQNLIGIVGPNGCGKSNVVDALRWVLGETQAKQLRGGKQEDLIFNGSEAKRALGLAEVSITIRPDENWTARAEQQQDELEKLLATDVSSEEESSSEDAQEESEKEHSTAESDAPQAVTTPNTVPSANVHTFLSEMPELLQASEIQFTRRLYRSGESEYLINRVPCRLRDMIDIYRYIGLGSRGLNIVQQGQIGELISKKPIERREVLEEAAGISGFRAKLEVAQRKLTRTNDNLARIKDIEIEVEKQVRVLKRQATRARTRNELKEKLRALEIEWFARRLDEISTKKNSDEARLLTLTQDVEGAEARHRSADAQFTESQAVLEEQDQRLFELRRQRDTWASVVREERERRQGIEKEMIRCETESQSIAGQKEDLSDREQKVFQELASRNQEKERVEAELREFQAQQQEAQESLETTRQEVAAEVSAIEVEIAQRLLQTEESDSVGGIDEMQTEIGSLESQLSDVDRVRESVRGLKTEIKETEQKLNAVSLKKASLSAEHSALKKQSEVVTAHVAKAVDINDSEEVLAPLSSGLVVPSELQRALDAALGDKGSFVVSPSCLSLARSYAEREAGSKKATFGVLDQAPVVDDSNVQTITSDELACAPSAKLLIDSIEISTECVAAAKALLGGVVVVDSLVEALAVREQSPSRQLVVTLAGEAVTPWGWYTTSGSGVDFSFARRLAELESSISECEEQESTISHALDAKNAQGEELEQELDAITALRRRIDEKRKSLNAMLQQERKQREVMQQEIRREEKRLRDAAMERERAAQLTVQEASSEVSRRVSQLAFIEERIFVLGSEVQDIESRRTQLGMRTEELKSLAADYEAALVAPQGEMEQATQKVEEFESLLKEIEDSRQGIASTHAELAQEVSETRRALEAARSKINDATLAVEKASLNVGMIKEEIETSYGAEAIADVESLIAKLSEEDAQVKTVQLLREDALALRKRLEREGEVDPDSIERYEEESARLENLKVQAADLEQAVSLLERTIRRLKELSRERFLATFKDVSSRFQQLVPRLFGGGAGHMELINPDDPLTSGVEISVRPPGKKLSSMELLSGGEKALVATAVLVAMFLHRPSPICVLDEVDAPLDEANLDRFISLVSEISSTTQFLIITHNKATMSAMGRLVGITMQERGVSTALTVTLDEAEEELERWVANA